MRREKLQSGSTPRKFSPSLLAKLVLLFVIGSLAHAANVPQPEPDVVRLLPGNDAVRRWEVYSDTLAYGAGIGLTDIYNGGYELYTDNGVLDAAQQMYRSVWRAEDIAIVTIHRMSSTETAQRFLDHWRDSDSKQPTFRSLNIGDVSYVYVADGCVYGHMIRDRFFVTVSMSKDHARMQVVAREYLRAVNESVSGILQPSEQR